MNHPLDPPATRLRALRKKSRMPVSRLRRNHRAHVLAVKSRANFYTEAGKLLYDRLISAVTGVRYDYTFEIMAERDARNTHRSRRRRPGGQIWLVATPVSQEAQRRVRQEAHLHQHPSVVERFEDRPTVSDIDMATGLDPQRQIVGEDKRTRDARIKREKRAQVRAAAAS